MTVSPDPGSARVEGVAVPPGRYVVQGVPRPRTWTVLGLLTLGLAAGYAGITAWDGAVRDAAVYNCPPDCGRPPNAVPVANLPRFTGPGFSVSRPPDNPRWQLSTGEDGVTARLVDGGGVMRLFGQPASGRTAREVVEQLMAEQYPGATVAYELPNAMVGYHPGSGVVADFPAPGFSTTFRLILMAAVKNDLALIAVGEGPFRRFSPDFGPGPPSAANLEIAMDMGTYIESFSWAGDLPP
ncbi:MAG: hypothetical protein KDB56_11060 [Mycobacterium sp.]|nr:hypothetical protein [Mycobacterium sp.]